MPIDWRELTTFERANEDIRAPWIPVPVLETLDDDITHLRLRVDGSWTVMGGLLPDCGPDGLPEVPLQLDRLFVGDCPVGALIGKFGRSSAAMMPAVAASADPSAIVEGKAFAIGSYCAVKVPEKPGTPLFAGFNCVVRPVKLITLKIRIMAASVPPT
jgi:hypothetical protein